MIAGKVTGSLISTRKCDNLVGNKFLVVEPLPGMGSKNQRIVAIDKVGAGIGEYVLVALGSAARIGTANENNPIDAAIVGILDEENNF